MTSVESIVEGITFNEEKMRQAILYFIHNGDPETLGKTKLMKLLYYADFDHYELHDDSITGAIYRRLPQGPVPTVAFPILERMSLSGDIGSETVVTPSFSRQRYTAHAQFEPSRFTPEEFATLEEVARTWKTVKMTDIVAASHDDPPWNAVADNAEIPYHLVYYRNTYGEMDLEEDEVDGEDILPTEDAFFRRPVYTMPSR